MCHLVTTRNLAKFYQLVNVTKLINLSVKRHITRFSIKFIIIHNKILYHCDSSFRDLGKKCFSISQLDNQMIINNLLDNKKQLIKTDFIYIKTQYKIK